MMAGMITLILTGLLFALRTRRALVLENLGPISPGSGIDSFAKKAETLATPPANFW
jgi:hypothetical protein